MKIASNTSIYSICPICKELIGYSKPIITMAYGFKEGEDTPLDMHVEESVMIHADCADSSVLGILLEKVESR